MKTKLTERELLTSILVFALCTAILALTMCCLIFFSVNGEILSFIKEYSKNIITAAVSIITLSAMLYVYFYFENKSVLANSRKIIEIYLMLVLSFIICFFVGKYVSGTARPLLFIALMTALFLRRRDAILVNTTFGLLTFIFNRYLNSSDNIGGLITGGIAPIESFASLLTTFCGGILAVFLMDKVKTRLGCVVIGVILCIPTIFINVIMQLPSEAVITWKYAFLLVGWAVFDCTLSVLLFMSLVPAFEGMFSELTPFRLRELTSDDAKLIKKLKENAPGTYNHSVVVAQLVEACAREIGENSELARAAAFYHDIGKLKGPEMFAENQTDYNFHNELTPELSVDIIRNHSRDGAKLIKKYRLPEFFADVALQHHGTMPIKYFYVKALKMSDGGLNMSNYSYRGPKPASKIAAIIMIADSSEAAVRSLRDRSPANVESLVRNLINERLDMEQFDDCNITMRELTLIKNTIVNQLTGVYHSRVEYPKLSISKKN